MRSTYLARRFFATGKNPRVFFDIAIDNTPKGKLVFEVKRITWRTF